MIPRLALFPNPRLTITILMHIFLGQDAAPLQYDHIYMILTHKFILYFLGQVPNCERCHDCYFQWYDIIGSFTDRADSLQSSMDDLITTHYNGHTEESLEQEIDGLRTQLDQVNLTLSAITLEEADVEEIEMILIEVCFKLC